MEIHPLSGRIGAELHGVDLSGALDDATWSALHGAFLAHHVVCFRDQKLDAQAQIALARHFGEPDVHPIVEGAPGHPELIRVWKPAGESASFGTGWHTDNTFFEKPSRCTVLYGEVIPPYGGDTLWASTEAAWDSLSAPMQERLLGLRAVHSASRAYDPAVTGDAKYKGEAAITYRHSEIIGEEVEHPVVRTHPETGRKGLFVNPMFTLRIAGMTDAESQAILRFLFEHITRPDFTCRFRWEPGSVAIWDNRCTQHYAMDDYREFERLMWRVTVQGDRPV